LSRYAPHDWVVHEGKNVITQQLTKSVQNLIKEGIRSTFNAISLHIRNILPLLGEYESLSKVIEELGIPEELLATAVEESLKTLHRVYFNVCQYREALLRIETFRDIEVENWKGIVIKFTLKGDYELLLKVWDELSRTVSKVLGEYNKYVYVAVEPYE